MSWLYFGARVFKIPSRSLGIYYQLTVSFTPSPPFSRNYGAEKATIQVDSQILWPRQSKISRISFGAVVHPVVCEHRELLYSLFSNLLVMEQNHTKCLRMLSSLWISVHISVWWISPDFIHAGSFSTSMYVISVHILWYQNKS